ncbi:MAG: OadG family protein [Desulfopila sp.]
MIIEGIKLMLIGMTTVMLFLTLTIYLIGLVSRLTRGVTEKELAAIRMERELLARSRRKQMETRGDAARTDESEDEIVAISAAVSAYEAERFAMS